MGLGLSLTTLVLLLWAGFAGDWQSFVNEWKTVPFIHLITLDFCLMSLIFPISSLFPDDMARRGIHDRSLFWSVALLPLLGPLLYLCLRPGLPEARQDSVDQNSTLPSSMAA